MEDFESEKFYTEVLNFLNYALKTGLQDFEHEYLREKFPPLWPAISMYLTEKGYAKYEFGKFHIDQREIPAYIVIFEEKKKSLKSMTVDRWVSLITSGGSLAIAIVALCLSQCSR